MKTKTKKSSSSWCFSRRVLLNVLLTLSFGSATAVKAGDRDTLSFGAVQPGKQEDRAESPQGYLKVYSSTNVFREGDARYFPHSPYTIYTLGGKLFRHVKNQRSADDEIPEIVTLPVGTYVVKAQSNRAGYVGMFVVIKKDEETILHLDVWETTTETRAEGT